MAMSSIICYFHSQLSEVLCDGSFIPLIDLRNSIKRCPYTINSDLEHFLLLSGLFSIPSDNLHRLHICSSHYQHLIKVQPKEHCELCKVLRNKPTFCRNLSSLRSLSKSLAVALWHAQKLSFYYQWTCTDCRHYIERYYVTDETKKIADQIYARLYDDSDDLIFPPEPSPMASPSSEYCPSFDELSSTETLNMTRTFQQLLREQHFEHRIESTYLYNTMNDKSKRAFQRQVKEVMMHVVKLLSHHDYREVWDDIVIRESKKYESNGNRQFDVAMQALADAYENAEHWSTRRQILAIMVADFPTKVIKQYFPNIKKWKISSARSHAHFSGRGAVVNTVRNPMIRYDIKQLEHFIDFFLSPHVTSDLPFGEKKIKLSTGQIVLVPNTIRNSISTKIIEQYRLYCNETQFEPLGDTVLYDILKHCSASTRKSLAGLDTCSANGSSAFAVLINLCDTLATYGAPPHDIAQLKTILHQSRNYIKLDYKLHIAQHSRIPDHCANYALSDPNEKKWSKNCDHVHDLQCESCSILTDALLQLRVLMKNTSSIPNNIRSRLLYKVDFNTNLILEWKKHQLRSVHQEKARQYALEELDNESVYVHMDWSMKFLPLKYREKMIDWFGKRGLCWHITHVVRLRKSSSHSTSSNTRTYEHRSFVHVFNNCTQNGPTVVSLLSDVFKRLKREDVQIKKAFVRSDNAGCFKGAKTLLSIPTLFEETGVLIRRFDFSEPQAGKSVCDRMAATIKGNVRRYVNEGNNCETSVDFVQAAKSTPYVTIAASKINCFTMSEQKVQWQGIKQFNNIQYEIKQNSYNYGRATATTFSIQATTWRAFGIGIGKQQQLEQKIIIIDPIETIAEHNDNGWKSERVSCHRKKSSNSTKDYDDESDNSSGNESGDAPSDESEEEMSNDDSINNNYIKNQMRVKSNGSPSVYNRQTGFITYDCDEPGCIKRFCRFKNLINHHDRGDHVYKPDNMRLRDKAIQLFKTGTESIKPYPIQQLHNFQVIYNTSTSSSDEESTTDDESETINYELQQGWALIEPTTNIRFSPDQLQFLNEKYEEGRNNGSKWDANAVFEEMQKKEDDQGNFIFDPSQFLTVTQIKSYFSRLARAQRLRGSQSQSKNSKSSNDYDEEETEEAENEFDSMLSDLHEQSIRSIAEDRFFTSQKAQTKSSTRSK